MLGLATLLAQSQVANAQGDRGGEALGITAGSFLIRPSLTLGTAYNDNIFAEENNEEDDFIFGINPALAVDSDWSRHSLGLETSAQILRYASNTGEDVENYKATTRGLLDITRDSNLYATVGFQQNHEERGSADDVNGAEPTEFTEGVGRLDRS